MDWDLLLAASEANQRCVSRRHLIAEVGQYADGGCRACAIERNMQRNRARREHLAQLKLARGCSICGYRKSAAALEFHHRDPAEKLFALAVGITRPWAAIESEITKCDVLCANCHAELHHEDDERSLAASDKLETLCPI